MRAESHPYIRKDLEILRPDIIIMPGSIFSLDRSFIEETVSDLGLEVEVIPAYQMNPTTLNCHISSKERMKGKWSKMEFDDLSEPMKEWFYAFKDRKEVEHVLSDEKVFLHLIPYLDYVFDNDRVRLASRVAGR